MIAVWFIIHDVVLAWTGQEVQWITWKEMDICNQAAEKGKKKCLLQELNIEQPLDLVYMQGKLLLARRGYS